MKSNKKVIKWVPISTIPEGKRCFIRRNKQVVNVFKFSPAWLRTLDGQWLPVDNTVSVGVIS